LNGQFKGRKWRGKQSLSGEKGRRSFRGKTGKKKNPKSV